MTVLGKGYSNIAQISRTESIPYNISQVVDISPQIGVVYEHTIQNTSGAYFYQTIRLMSYELH